MTKKKSDEETAVESESCDASAIPIVDHDPVAAYVNQLVSCYSHLASFYYDRYTCLLLLLESCFIDIHRFGGTVVAVKLKSGPEKVMQSFLNFKNFQCLIYLNFLYGHDQGECGRSE